MFFSLTVTDWMVFLQVRGERERERERERKRASERKRESEREGGGWGPWRRAHRRTIHACTYNDDDVFCLFLQKQKRSRAPYTLRKVRTIRGCLEGCAGWRCCISRARAPVTTR
jgi:hypothetical protein